MSPTQTPTLHYLLHTLHYVFMCNIQVLDSLRTKLLLMTKAQLKCALDIPKLEGEKRMHENNNEEAELLKYTFVFSKWYFIDIWLTKSESV